MNTLVFICAAVLWIPSVFSWLCFSLVEVNFNKALFDIRYNHTCDGKHDLCVVNADFDSFKVIDKATMYFKLKIPENEHDNEFKRELIRSVVDVEKVIKGVNGNPILQAITKDLFKSINFEPKFPFPPGLYEYRNLTIYDQFVPVFTTTKANAELRFVGKVAGNKNSQFFFSGNAIGEIRR